MSLFLSSALRFDLRSITSLNLSKLLLSRIAEHHPTFESLYISSSLLPIGAIWSSSHQTRDTLLRKVSAQPNILSGLGSYHSIGYFFEFCSQLVFNRTTGHPGERIKESTQALPTRLLLNPHRVPNMSEKQG